MFVLEFFYEVILLLVAHHLSPSPDFVLGGGRRRGPGRLESPSLLSSSAEPDLVLAGGLLCLSTEPDLVREGGFRVASRMANNISLDF